MGVVCLHILEFGKLSRMTGRGSKVEGRKSRSRDKSRNRGSKVEAEGQKWRSRVEKVESRKYYIFINFKSFTTI